MVRRVRAAGTHAVARYSKTACVRSAHTLQMGRLPEIHFSGSLLRQAERAAPVLAAFVNKGKTCC